jgi:hypothetical protein
MQTNLPGDGITNHILCALGLAVILSSACTKAPTPEECRQGIIRMMKIQLDSSDFQKLQEQVAATGPGTTGPSNEQLRQGTEWLKNQIPALVTPEFVAQCIERMQRQDLQCTMAATTVDELINQCHWKVGQGPRGPTLGF